MRNVTVFVKLVLCLFTLSSLSSTAMARGTSSGGGSGSHIRDTFIAAGKRVIYYLLNDERGQRLVKSEKLDVCRLNASLNEKLIFIVNDENGMKDYGGSDVDAFTYHWRIHIGKNVWEKRIHEKTDIYYLVFKEMLRSETTDKMRFDSAVDIAQNIRPFPVELNLEHNLSLDSLKTIGTKCLTDEDEKIIEGIKIQSKLYNEEVAPECVVDPSEKTSIADQLLASARRTECTVVPGKCGISDEVFTEGDYMDRYKSIFWKGERIYSKKFARINRHTLEGQDLMSVRVKTDVINKKAELAEYGICDSTGVKFDNNSPDIGFMRDQFGDSLLNFSYLAKAPVNAPRQMCEKDCLQKKYVGFVGEGSRIQMLDRKVYFNDVNASFLKIRVLDNTISHISSDGTINFSNGLLPFTPYKKQYLPVAKTGDEGYVTMSETSFFEFFDPYTKVIGPR